MCERVCVCVDMYTLYVCVKESMCGCVGGEKGEGEKENI